MDDFLDTSPIASDVSKLDATVECVEIHEFQHEVENASVEPGGFSRVYEPGAISKMTSFMVRIFASDGTVGEYCPIMGGRAWHMAPKYVTNP